MKTNELTRMPQPVNKGILCSESVKAKMNGSYVASLDRFSPKNGERLPVGTSEHNPGCSVKYFLTQTHFNELSLGNTPSSFSFYPFGKLRTSFSNFQLLSKRKSTIFIHFIPLLEVSKPLSSDNTYFGKLSDTFSKERYSRSITF